MRRGHVNCLVTLLVSQRSRRGQHITIMVARWLLPCCGPEAFGERHVLAVMAFLCTFNLYLSRFNLR